jgi:hypothetical protein
MSDDLVKRLQTVSAMISLGERIPWGHDTALTVCAAAEIQALRAERDDAEAWEQTQRRRAEAAEAEVARLREALMDIADSKRLTSWGDPGTLRDRARAALTAQGDAE